MRKKLFAILMSAMMMVTFMPAMAFAATGCADTSHHWYVKASTVKWEADYSKVTGDIYCADCGQLVQAGVAGTITKTMNATDAAHAGRITAKAVWGDCYVEDATSSTKVGTLQIKVKSSTLADNYVNAFYADVTGATFTFATDYSITPNTYVAGFNNGKAVEVALSTYDFTKMTLAVPAGVDAGKDANGVARTTVDAGTYTVSLLKTNYRAKAQDASYALYEEGTYTQDVAPSAAYAATTGDKAIIGTTTMDVKVKKGSTFTYLTLDAAGYVDANNDPVTKTIHLQQAARQKVVQEWTSAAFKYDGAEHAITCTDKNVNVEFAATKKYNEETKAYVAIDEKDLVWNDSFVLKDAGDYYFTVRIATGNTSIKGNKYAYGDNEYKVTVARAVAKFGFDSATPSVQAGEEYNAMDFVTCDGDKKAIAANKAELDACFADYYTVKATPDKYNPLKVALDITPKALSTAEKNALAKKYEGLTKNVNLQEPTVVHAVLTIYAGENVVVAADQTKTYHNKKGKLAKTYTFKLKGDVATFGTLKYVKKSGNSKIQVASTGKVTVKKGLKKGTYTVKIKVIGAGGATDVKTLKVKMVK